MFKLKGKFKEDLFEWLNYSYAWEDDIDNIFKSMPQSAQFGLIQEYCDTIKYDLEIILRFRYDWTVWNDLIKVGYGECKTRSEAQIKAVEQIQKIINV